MINEQKLVIPSKVEGSQAYAVDPSTLLGMTQYLQLNDS